MQNRRPVRNRWMSTMLWILQTPAGKSVRHHPAIYTSRRSVQTNRREVPLCPFIPKRGRLRGGGPQKLGTEAEQDYNLLLIMKDKRGNVYCEGWLAHRS